jgi:hypothetical protein
VAQRKLTLTAVSLREQISHHLPALLNASVVGWTGHADEEARVLVLKVRDVGTLRVPFEAVRYYMVSGAPVTES